MWLYNKVREGTFLLFFLTWFTRMNKFTDVEVNIK